MIARPAFQSEASASRRRRNHGRRPSEKDGTLKISGVVPDETGRQAIGTAARRMFPECDVIDGTGVNTRLPDRWMKAAIHALDLLRLLDNGSVEITDQSIRLKGDAPAKRQLKMIDARATEIPNGFSLNSEVTAPGRQARCRRNLLGRNGSLKPRGE